MPPRRAALVCLFTAICGSGCVPARLIVSDTYQIPGSDSVMMVRAESRVLGYLLGIGGVRVRFVAGEQQVGETRTDLFGRAMTTCRLPDGTHECRVEAGSGLFDVQGTARVFAWSPQRTAIICDIDGTLSDTDVSSLLSSTFRDSESEPLPGAVETLQALASDYDLLYLTARPGWLRDKTALWLKEHGFSEAPLITTPGLRLAAISGTFKREVIQAIQKTVPTVCIGIGNARSDSQAYTHSGLLTLILFDSGEERRYSPHPILVRDWAVIRAFFERNREVLRDPQRLRTAIDAEDMFLRPLIQRKDK